MTSLNVLNLPSLGRSRVTDGRGRNEEKQGSVGWDWLQVACGRKKGGTVSRALGMQMAGRRVGRKLKCLCMMGKLRQGVSLRSHGKLAVEAGRGLWAVAPSVPFPTYKRCFSLAGGGV